MQPAIVPQSPQVELTHVLVMDIVGYSLLAESDQRRLLERLQELVRGTSEFGKARDRIIPLPAGNGMALVFSGDPEAALRCAVGVSSSARRFANLKLRMGVHSGPVSQAADFSFNFSVSAGIDVAYRVMDYGDAGHILVSKSVTDVLQQLGRWNSNLHDLGEAEIRSGLRLHLFSLWNEEVGNPEPPQRLLALAPRVLESNAEVQLLGKLVSHYLVLRKLGEGGMAVVYEAKDIRLGRHVAIKFLPEQFSRNQPAVERFQREACTASSLNHPNICTIHDIGVHDSQRFIVMELLDGRNLKQTIAGSPLPMERAIALGIQIADALEAAHARGIIHRDIKAANIFVDRRDRVKVLDFGLAKLTGRNRALQDSSNPAPEDEPTRQDLTASGEFVGTVSYMSPEQARGETLDQRSDLFSFGVILYEMASGQLPFRGDTSAVVFDSILNRQPDPINLVNPRVSPGLERIIGRALEKKRDIRFQSATDLGSELRRLAMRSGPAAPEPAAQPAQVPAKERNDLQIVLLYKRNAEPDEQLMQALEKSFSQRGYQVFVDRHLAVGVEWAREIERKIGSADAVIPLLSEASVQSEMLSYEVQLAQQFSERQGGRPRVLPVRLSFSVELPDALRSVLDGLNYLMWEGSGDDSQVLEGLQKALHTPHEAFRRKPNLEPVGGALLVDSRFYIVRPTDQELYSALARNESIVLIKGARQMGKTSLMARGLQQARRAGARIVLTDFQKLNSEHLQSVESLLLCLTEALAEQLDIDAVPRESWNPRRGPSMNFDRFLRHEILNKMKGRLVWGIDEVDRLFACSFGSEVFGLFRSWHNERSLDPSGPWQKLTLAIAYASEAHMFIVDVNQSPFNVGTRLVLMDFTLDQVRELNERYGSPLRSPDELQQFFALLSGHPFLTQRGLHQMTDQSIGFGAFATGAAQDEGPYGDHLRRIFVSLNQDPALCEVVREVLSGRCSSDSDSFYRLRSSGIVAGDSARDMKLRCQLYEQYLSRHLC